LKSLAIMKKFYQNADHETDKSKSAETKKRKNMRRLGGGGLSLQTFANMKSENNRYNPSLISKRFFSLPNLKKSFLFDCNLSSSCFELKLVLED
jgi:hypothetical protein